MFINFVKSPFGIAAISVNVVIIGVIIYLVKSGKKDDHKPIKEDDQSQ